MYFGQSSPSWCKGLECGTATLESRTVPDYFFPLVQVDGERVNSLVLVHLLYLQIKFSLPLV